MTRTLLIAAALAACLAAPAAAAPSADKRLPARQCFSASQIANYRASDDDRALYVRVRANEVYRLDLLTRCPDVGFSNQIAIRSRGGAMNICSGLDAVILAPSVRGARRCEVRSVSRMTPQEVAALPSRERP